MTDHIYKVSIRAGPWTSHLYEWYGEDGKRFPRSLELSPRKAKAWYVCDGGLSGYENSNWRSRAQFSVANEQDRPELLKGLFHGVDADPYLTHHILRFNVDDTETLLRWMGPSPPGFEHKWEVTR